MRLMTRFTWSHCMVFIIGEFYIFCLFLSKYLHKGCGTPSVRNLSTENMRSHALGFFQCFETVGWTTERALKKPALVTHLLLLSLDHQHHPRYIQLIVPFDIYLTLSLESTPQLCQPHLSPSVSVLPVHAPTTSSHSVNSPLSPFITPSFFHSRLKTYLFDKSFPPQTPFRPQD